MEKSLKNADRSTVAAPEPPVHMFFTAEGYRGEATECERLAAQAKDSQSKSSLEKMAAFYRQLAAKLERWGARLEAAPSKRNSKTITLLRKRGRPSPEQSNSMREPRV